MTKMVEDDDSMKTTSHTAVSTSKMIEKPGEKTRKEKEINTVQPAATSSSKDEGEVSSSELSMGSESNCATKGRVNVQSTVGEKPEVTNADGIAKDSSLRVLSDSTSVAEVNIGPTLSTINTGKVNGFHSISPVASTPPDKMAINAPIPSSVDDCIVLSSSVRKRGGDELSSLLTQPIKKERMDPGYNRAMNRQNRPVVRNPVRPVVITPLVASPVVRFAPRPLPQVTPHSRALTRILLTTPSTRLSSVQNAPKTIVIRNVVPPSRNGFVLGRPTVRAGTRIAIVNRGVTSNVAPRKVVATNAARKIQPLTRKNGVAIPLTDATVRNIGERSSSTLNIAPKSCVTPSMRVRQNEVTTLLLKRPPSIRSYKPPSMPTELVDHLSPIKYHPCLQCGDMFLLESSLLAHMTRRSVEIEWSLGRRPVEWFYNRCAMMERLTSAGVTVEQANVKLSPLRVEVDVSSSLTCGECGHLAATPSELQAHLDGDKTTFVRCKDCRLCLTGCRATAHARSHALRKPHVCPECGAHGFAHADTFTRHLRDRCHHFERFIRYECALCKGVFPTLTKSRIHVVTKHVQAYRKCQTCPMAFRSIAAFKTHCTSTDKCSSSSATDLLKCALCDTVFKKPEQLDAHLSDDHLIEHMSRAKFVCATCDAVSDTLDEHVVHLAKAHPNRGPADAATAVFARCDHCAVDFSDSAAYTRHVRKHRFMAARASQSQSQVAPVVVPVPLPVPHLACQVCGEMVINDAELAEHERREHGTERSFACHLCAHTFADADQLECHHSAVHNASVAVHTPAAHCYVCPVCKVEGVHHTFKRRTHLDKHLSQAHHYDTPGVLTASVVPAPPVKKESPAPLKTLRSNTGEFVCAKCDFSDGERAVFTQHIVKHRSRECAAQCPDCGLCFAVIPSLKRHLIVVHRIKDLSQYRRDTGVVLTPPPSPPPAPLPPIRTPDDPRQCGVCFLMFDDVSAVRKHMRTHGMAFIRTTCVASTSAVSQGSVSPSDSGTSINVTE